jgi:hypothetical protein
LCFGIEGYAEDKDSLSVRVAYIKVNISRSRQLLRGRRASNATTNALEASQNGLAGSAANIGHGASATSPSQSLNDVKLSVLADIGNTSFIYDMRNIKEVFVFPKIWFRRSLARRLFLGEENAAPQTPLTPTPQMPNGESFRMGTEDDIDNFFRMQQHTNQTAASRGNFI